MTGEATHLTETVARRLRDKVGATPSGCVTLQRPATIAKVLHVSRQAPSEPPGPRKARGEAPSGLVPAADRPKHHSMAQGRLLDITASNDLWQTDTTVVLRHDNGNWFTSNHYRQVA